MLTKHWKKPKALTVVSKKLYNISILVMNKKTLTRVLLGLIAITTVATVIAYFVIKPDRPWMAFYVACCGGVLVFNFLISLFLVNKNLKK